MQKWLRARDGLGATPQMTYKSNETYGTSLGGLFSCTCRYFIGFYVSLVFFGFFFSSNFSESRTSGYSPNEGGPVNNVSAYDMIPAFQVMTLDSDQTPTDINNSTLFEIELTVKSPGFKSEPVASLTCDEYITKYLSDLNEDQLSTIKSEMFNKPENFICPDLSVVSLSGTIIGKRSSL